MRNSVALVVLCVFLAACQTTGARTINKLQTTQSQNSILVMPVDVELSELQASGAKTVHAEWTKTATDLVASSLEKFMAERNARTIDYRRNAEDEQRSHIRTQLQKLHNTVGGTVIRHHLFEQLKLPSKKGNFDWTLGPQTAVLRDEFSAEYALFVFVRDSYTTTGRAIAMILAAGLGASLHGGQQIGFASLVDVRTGDLVWFNLLARGTGDMRNPEGADDTIKSLLKDFPA